MTTVRGLVAAAVVAPIVSVFTVFTTATPAAAVARLDAPSRVTSHQTVTLSGTVDHLFDAVLFVDGRQVAKGDRKVSYAWRPSDHRNGIHRIRLEQKGKLLGAEWHRISETLTQAAPPVTPGRPTVRLRGGQVTLTWRKGPEPDLRKYEITVSRTGRVGSVKVKSACSGRVCGATIAVPANAAGRRIGFTVRALRADGAGGMVASGDSATTSVTVPPPGRVRQGRKAGDPRSSGVRSGTVKRKPGDRNSTQGDGEQNAKDGDRDGGGEAPVRDLPRLPAPETATTASGPPETGPGPHQPSGTSAAENHRTTAPTGRDTGDDRRTQESGGEVIASSGPRADGTTRTTGTTGTGDLVAADRTDAAARSSDSPDGGMSMYGVVIAGAMMLLLAGAHGGAWFRRRSLITGRKAADVNDMATSPVTRSFTGDVFDDEHGDGRSQVVTAGHAVEVIAARHPGDVDRGVMAGGSGESRGGADVTVTPGRPAVILAVIKAHSISKRPSSASPGQIRLISPDRIVPAPDPSALPSPAQRSPTQPSPAQPSPGRMTSDPLLSGQVASDPPPSRRAASDRTASERAISGRAASDPSSSDVIPPDSSDVPIQPIVVRPASLRLAAVRAAPSPRVGTERRRGAKRPTNTEQQEKAKRKPDAEQRGEVAGREEPRRQAGRKRPGGRRMEGESSEGRQAGFPQVPIQHTKAERAQETQVRTRSAQAGQARAEQLRAEQAQAEQARNYSVQLRTTWVGLTRDEAMRVETVRTESVPADHAPADHAPAEHVRADHVQAGALPGETARVADRWDDYLPPAPRSMEDSGFWGRPQPGATDFWGDDRHSRDE